MFLAERLVGISVFLTLLIGAYYLISRLQFKQVKYMLFIYLMAISVVAFLYVPAAEADLYRLTQYMFEYASYSQEGFYATLIESSTPVALVYFRIIGSMGIAGLLPAISVFIVFGNLFYIIYNYVRNSRLQGRVVAYALLVLMGTGIFMQTVSGIRNMLAFSILARCFYEEVYNDKKMVKNIIWYILACLIHPAAILAVLLRLGALMWYKGGNGHFRSLIATLFALAAAVCLLLYLGAAVYLNNATDMFVGYVEGEVAYNYLWDNIITVLTLIFIFLNYKIYKYQKLGITKAGHGQLIFLSYGLSIISTLFFFEHTIFVRFTQLNLIIMLPVVISNMAILSLRAKKSSLNQYILHKAMHYIPLFILLISATRGALSSLKFFIL